MTAIFLLLWAIAVIVAFIHSDDPVSPSKYVLATIGIYFGGIFVQESQPPLVIVCFCGLLGVAIITALKERPIVQRTRKIGASTKKKLETDSMVMHFGPKVRFVPRYRYWSLIVMVWVLSCIPLGVYVWVISRFGGIDGYLEAMKGRVQAWRGIGYILIFASLLPTINLIYAVIMMSLPGREKFLRLFYSLHLAMTLLVMIWTGSRTQLLNVIAVGFLLYHYLRKRVSAMTFGVLVACLLASAGFLGALREVYKIEEGRIETNLHLSEKTLRLDMFSYALQPLQVLAEGEIERPLLGASFLSVFTNVIPRDFWPGKPDTGGVLFTKLYMGDQWDGMSNATPGLIGESIMNFGKILGVFFGFGLLLLILSRIVYYYNGWVLFLQRRRWVSIHDGLNLLIYIYSIQWCSALLVGEFTNVTISSMFFVIFITFVKWLVVRIGIRSGSSAS